MIGLELKINWRGLHLFHVSADSFEIAGLLHLSVKIQICIEIDYLNFVFHQFAIFSGKILSLGAKISKVFSRFETNGDVTCQLFLNFQRKEVKIS